MSGDYSRIAFDPMRNYSGVSLQQGRPLTDRDWNDQGAAVNRRAQAGTLDAGGPVIVSKVTPDAFKILQGLLIGRGRMYVDGLLADNHGADPQKWDATLAELYDGNAVAFAKQPYLPDQTAPSSGGPYLVYLDVWNREVTQFEDPDLVEKALGVDTTTRVQTIWQVKLLDVAAGTTCATPLDQIPAWRDKIAPSAGRLTTGTAPVSNPDPCLVPPAGGYKGLENQLYRVEVHLAGPLGKATFKWSRDNASVEARITREIDASHIVVDSVGKDSVLRFSDGDWIEITDDTRELKGEAGELHKIKTSGGVDDATRTITLEKQLGFKPDISRHARIRRWDQKGQVIVQDKDNTVHIDLDDAAIKGENGIPTAKLALRIEDGVIVTFSEDPAGGDFHVGDYWIFAARSSDASIEILNKAPPRGIHHHYAKLAIYSPPSDPQDCRPKEEECCCTITVSPGGDIQAAINALPAAGGCVCLKTGIHTALQGLMIARSNVKLVGESHGTTVRGPHPGAVLTISGGDKTVEGIEISMIAFERASEETKVPAVIAVNNARRSAILDCQVLSKSVQTSIGIQLANVEEFRVARCRIEQVTTAILAAGPQTRTLFIDDNVVDLVVDTTKFAAFGIVVAQISGPCRIAGNSLRGAPSGIVVNGQITGAPQPGATDVIVAKNIVVCAPAPPATANANALVFGIDMAAHSGIVSQNLLQLPGGSRVHAGIRVTGDNIDVLDNQIVPIPGSKDSGFTGILVGDKGALTNDIRVAGNFITGAVTGILANIATAVIVESNLIELGDGGDNDTGIGLQSVKDGQVKGNRVTGSKTAIRCAGGGPNQVIGNMLANSNAGVSIEKETAPVIAQNRIDGMVLLGIQCSSITGRCDIVENRITSCGFKVETGMGIDIVHVEGELRIEANEVMDTGLSPDRRTSATLAIGIAGTFVQEASIENNTIGYTDPASRPVTGEDRALAMACLQEKRESPTGPTGYPIQILGNKFIGPGKTALVEIREQQTTGDQTMRFERVFFSNNYCAHYPLYGTGASTSKAAGTVSLFGRSATVMGNQIKALRPPGATPVFASFNFNGMPGPCIGNVTSGAIVQRTDLPPTLPNFNLIG